MERRWCLMCVLALLACNQSLFDSNPGDDKDGGPGAIARNALLPQEPDQAAHLELLPDSNAGELVSAVGCTLAFLC